MLDTGLLLRSAVLDVILGILVLISFLAILTSKLFTNQLVFNEPVDWLLLVECCAARALFVVFDPVLNTADAVKRLACFTLHGLPSHHEANVTN